MKTIQISRLVSPAIEWVLLKLEGHEIADKPAVTIVPDGTQFWPFCRKGEDTVGNLILDVNKCWRFDLLTYVTGKAGDDIIDREKIETRWIILDADGGYWQAQNLFTDTYGYTGTTRRLAAMRCFIASKKGDTIEVPEELL